MKLHIHQPTQVSIQNVSDEKGFLVGTAEAQI